ncbi:GTP-binding signal recognition particle [Asticcacaulis biprosthecium C19]|uniref:GTP-binding signal recognition particle n=1 Tax=Asticcacaulis biprosthecium C19 TaxID=715226 RepID=F4QRU7_9CAUL|nr:GxxExxY protein [Asticcacaulis biprosthecium]EGF89467.1 GTP-binding signal recognition particle [Asticcacaulis biprosthecium C19]
MDDVLFRDEVFAIQGAIFDVNREMGSGFLEAVYQECLAKEFELRNIPFSQHKTVSLTYKGQALTQTYQPDFICYEAIILELKVCQEISSAHRAQILNYLKATKLRLGLLINFGTHPKAQIERFVL